jgi:hypothetical protein
MFFFSSPGFLFLTGSCWLSSSSRDFRPSSGFTNGWLVRYIISPHGFLFSLEKSPRVLNASPRRRVSLSLDDDDVFYVPLYDTLASFSSPWNNSLFLYLLLSTTPDDPRLLISFSNGMMMTWFFSSFFVSFDRQSVSHPS